MPQTMTLDEKLAVLCKAAAFRQAGNEAEHDRLVRSVPMPPSLLGKNLQRKSGCGSPYKWRLEFVGSRGRVWTKLA